MEFGARLPQIELDGARLTLADLRPGAQRVFVWPLADELRQLELFHERVVPLIPAV